MNYELRFLNKTTRRCSLSSTVFLSIFFFLCSFASFSQVTSAIDSTSIKIGEQITYHIQVETDTTSLVVFPEGQTFQPLEMIESYEIDTLKKSDKYNLIKKYGLTQFDSGAYTIPRQKIIIGDKTFFTDSLKVEVNNITVDTTKQGLYDIKPLIEVKKPSSNWWKYVLLTLLIIGIIAFLLFWFIWRKKPLTEEEEIALLPPYDRAKLALKKLDESHYLEHSEIKEYYSELTGIIRKYLDEKVYDHSLESTTDELISRLRLLKEGNQIDLSQETIKNVESILKRADLVKFAKSAPDIVLAELDRDTIDSEIDHVKEVLPEPTEEEKLLDEKYREELERKKTRKKIIITVGISLFLIIATFAGFSIKYGFGYVKDTIIGHDTKELLEGDWVTSAYGVPPITISTPKVLKRQQVILKDSLQEQKSSKNDAFYYGSMMDRFYVIVRSVPVKPQDLAAYFSQNNEVAQQIADYDEDQLKEFTLNYFAEEFMKVFESQGAENIIIKKEPYTNILDSSKGLKSHGSFVAKNAFTGNEMNYQYQIFLFAENEAIQTIMFMYQNEDIYAKDIIEKTIQSIELKKAEE